MLYKLYFNTYIILINSVILRVTNYTIKILLKNIKLLNSLIYGSPLRPVWRKKFCLLRLIAIIFAFKRKRLRLNANIIAIKCKRLRLNAMIFALKRRVFCVKSQKFAFKRKKLRFNAIIIAIKRNNLRLNAGLPYCPYSSAKYILNTLWHKILLHYQII